MGIAVVMVIAAFYVALNFSSDAETTAEKVGDGNLKVTSIGERKFLVNESQDLTLFTGERARGYRSTDVIEVSGQTFKPEKSEIVAVKMELNGRETKLDCLKVDDTVVSCEESIQISPDQSRILIELGEGLWIMAADGTRLRNAALDGYSATMDKLHQYEEIAPDFYYTDEVKELLDSQHMEGE